MRKSQLYLWLSEPLTLDRVIICPLTSNSMYDIILSVLISILVMHGILLGIFLPQLRQLRHSLTKLRMDVKETLRSIQDLLKEDRKLLRSEIREDHEMILEEIKASEARILSYLKQLGVKIDNLNEKAPPRNGQVRNRRPPSELN